MKNFDIIENQDLPHILESIADQRIEAPTESLACRKAAEELRRLYVMEKTVSTGIFRMTPQFPDPTQNLGTDEDSQ